MIGSLSAAEIAYCGGVLLLSYGLRGSSGFGGAIGMPLLALLIPIKVLAPAWTLLGIASSITILGRDRKQVDRRELVLFLPWCAIGIAIGLYVFKTLDAAALSRVLGVTILVYASHALWLTIGPKAAWRLSPEFTRRAAGILSGLVGTLFGAMASIFFAMHLYTREMGKHAFRATLSAMLLTLSVIRTVAYAAVGELGYDAIVIFATAFPAMLVGIYLGDRFHSNISEIAFRRLVCALLMLCGIPLLLK